MSEFIITSEQMELLAEAVGHYTTRPITEVIIKDEKLPEIVRCEDCNFFDTRKCKSLWPFRLDGFCAWGRAE